MFALRSKTAKQLSPNFRLDCGSKRSVGDVVSRGVELVATGPASRGFGSWEARRDGAPAPTETEHDNCHKHPDR